MKIASVSGIPIRVHWSFLALMGAFVVYAGVMAGMPGIIATTLVAMGLFASVMLHELGHAMAAKHYGIETAHITMYPFGGIAAITRMPEEPHQELVIALAGPAVNFVLVGVFGLAWAATGNPLWTTFIAMNLIMGLFNLIPAFPMDGGRVLRALLATRMGWFPASRLSIRIGRVFAWGFLAVGLVTWWPSLLLVGAFLHVALTAEKERLVWMVWEQRTGTTPPWDPPKSWGAGASSGPKWVIAPRV